MVRNELTWAIGKLAPTVLANLGNQLMDTSARRPKVQRNPVDIPQ